MLHQQTKNRSDKGTMKGMRKKTKTEIVVNEKSQTKKMIYPPYMITKSKTRMICVQMPAKGKKSNY